MLKEKFDGAHEVKQKRKNGRRMLVTKFSRFKKHRDVDLVYLVTSPDYCEYDVKKGSLGTSGRECDPVRKHSKWQFVFTNLPDYPVTCILYCQLNLFSVSEVEGYRRL